MPQLWDFYDGEPFMENPYLGIVNPVKGRKKNMAHRKGVQPAGLRRYWAAHRKKNAPRRKKSHSRARRRRNAYPMAGMVSAVNPRKHHRRARRNPVMRHHRRHHPRRNPVMGFSVPPIKCFVFGALGYTATPMIAGFLNTYLPTAITGNNVGKYGVLLVSGLITAIGVQKLSGSDDARYAAIGSGIYIIMSAVNDFSSGLVPGLAAYAPAHGMGTYINPGMRGMKGLAAAGGTSIARWSNRPQQSGAIGGTADRFKRI